MNKVILYGRMTQKPELRYTESNTPYVRFSLAVNRPRIKDKQPEADFINCIAWNKTAETIDKYFDKGSRILVSGRIQVSNYTDKEGNKKTINDIVIEDFNFLDKKENKEEPKKEVEGDPFDSFGNALDDNYLE